MKMGRGDDHIDKALAATNKKRKRNKYAQLDSATVITDAEYKKWINEKNRLCREPRPMRKRIVPSLEMATSLPMQAYYGKTLTAFYL